MLQRLGRYPRRQRLSSGTPRLQERQPDLIARSMLPRRGVTVVAAVEGRGVRSSESLRGGWRSRSIWNGEEGVDRVDLLCAV